MNINEFEEVMNFIKEQGLEHNLLKVKDLKAIHKINLSYLKQIDDTRYVKEFLFEFYNNKFYYIFITVENNPNYCKSISNNENKMFSNISNNSNKNIPKYFEFHNKKFIIYLNICHKESSDKIEYYLKISMDKEVTSVSHATYDSINFYKEVKTIIDKENCPINYVEFSSLLEKYFIIELETKKHEKDITLKEDGVLNVLFLLTNNESDLTEVYTLIKYSIFYAKPSLINYVSKYIYDIVYNFTHLPNENLLKFLENFCIIIPNDNSQKIIFPTKKNVECIRNLYYLNKIKYLNKQMPNIKITQSMDSVPIHKFIKLLNKYDLFSNEKELKIKESYLNKKKDRYNFLNSHGIFSDVRNSISKEYKINLNQALTNFMSKINENLKMFTNVNNTLAIDKFMMNSLNKYIMQYVSYKGFINIDIVLNEDSMININCCNNRRYNNSCNEFTFNLFSKLLNFFNFLYDFNEGFFHKHFNLLDYYYNFNEKNIIHVAPSCYDPSKKNKIRVFDIPFTENWLCLISNLILFIWKNEHGLGAMDENDLEFLTNEKFKEKSIEKFLELYSHTIDTITNELFDLYEEAFPDFYNFCYKISKFPLNKYNNLDNICQHFTNSSIQILLKNNLIFFQPFELIYKINEESLLKDGIRSQPILNSVIEPYLIYIDKELNDYINVKEKKEKFLKDKDINELQKYFGEMKNINSDKLDYNLILGNNNRLNTSNIDKKKYNLLINELNTSDLVNDKDNSLNIDVTYVESELHDIPTKKYSYNFSFLLNLSYYFIRKIISDIRVKMIKYWTFKRKILSLASSLSVSFDGYERSILRIAPSNMSDLKRECKKEKNFLMKNLRNIDKIKSRNENMLYIFYNYMRYVILKIKGDKNYENSYNGYIKIGYFLINLKTINSSNSVDKFFESEFNLINY